MSAPDSTQEEVRTSVLRYIRMYEEGALTLGDLAAELSIYASAYKQVIGSIDDHLSHLLDAAYEHHRLPGAGMDELESALRDFRRTEAAW